MVSVGVFGGSQDDVLHSVQQWGEGRAWGSGQRREESEGEIR